MARLTPIRHPETHPVLHSIVTLATPHSNPLYAFEKSVRNIHQQIQQEQHNDTFIVSVSGGMRDEMIESGACHAHHAHSISVLSTRLLSNVENGLGMDHRAIVWCHGVLSRVREIIWALSDDKDVDERRRSVVDTLGPETFEGDMDAMKAAMKVRWFSGERNKVSKDLDIPSRHVFSFDSCQSHNMDIRKVLPWKLPCCTIYLCCLVSFLSLAVFDSPSPTFLPMLLMPYHFL